MKKSVGWELSIGTYAGVLIGARTYNSQYQDQHVFYLPFVDVCLTILYDDEGSE